ncbi:hypothetical protein HYALB_00013073 [Hymenoscyphus albidus]|uniref:Uncharacterized protein n=1 Tax=Hymenoscyphus albidus TaxID=595503 RepID=A0A9N9LU36_9HELO|nr:hypothetical protein HYALB_00013073 [Hymenoscyphus albidus]
MELGIVLQRKARQPTNSRKSKNAKAEYPSVKRPIRISTPQAKNRQLVRRRPTHRVASQYGNGTREYEGKYERTGTPATRILYCTVLHHFGPVAAKRHLYGVHAVISAAGLAVIVCSGGGRSRAEHRRGPQQVWVSSEPGQVWRLHTALPLTEYSVPAIQRAGAGAGSGSGSGSGGECDIDMATFEAADSVPKI